jgi:hypothetical protein
VPFLILLACALLVAQPWLAKQVQQRRRRRRSAHSPVMLLAVLLSAVYGAYFGAGSACCCWGCSASSWPSRCAASTP